LKSQKYLKKKNFKEKIYFLTIKNKMKNLELNNIKKTFIIAEIGINHEGSVIKCKKINKRLLRQQELMRSSYKQLMSMKVMMPTLDHTIPSLKKIFQMRK
jgi:hypothetical protein